MKPKIFINSIFLVTVALSTVSCGKKFLQEEVISGISNDFYTTQTGIESGVAAAYDPLRFLYSEELSGSLQVLGTDLYLDGRDASYSRQLNNYEATLNSTMVGTYSRSVYGSGFHALWQNFYFCINRANTMLQAIDAIGDGMPADLKTVRAAEMRFLRALSYFTMVQQFGPIPLITVAEVGVKTDYTRSPVPDVYNLIIADLRFASDNLPATQAQYGRATKGAAQHALATVYLTRGSAVTDQRGQKPSDIDSAAYYADQVINSGVYSLVPNYKDLWDINNERNPEVVFAVQFSQTTLYNNLSGNRMHMFFNTDYDRRPGMRRDVANGRPWDRFRPTNFMLLELFDRKNDSRFYKSFKTVWFANNGNNLPTWLSVGGFVPPPDLAGKPKFNLGDTSIWMTLENWPANTNFDSLYASRPYHYIPLNRQDNFNYMVLVKHLDPSRLNVNDEAGFRDGCVYRLAETYLIAAEAYGRKGDFATAVQRLNVIRTRAAYKDGEAKPGEFWRVEGGDFADRFESTESELQLTESDISGDFINFILDERARELQGEFKRWGDLVRTEKLLERAQMHNPRAAINIKPYHKLRPIPQEHIDRLDPKGPISEEQNEGYY